MPFYKKTLLSLTYLSAVITLAYAQNSVVFHFQSGAFAPPEQNYVLIKNNLSSWDKFYEADFYDQDDKPFLGNTPYISYPLTQSNNNFTITQNDVYNNQHTTCSIDLAQDGSLISTDCSNISSITKNNVTEFSFGSEQMTAGLGPDHDATPPTRSINFENKTDYQNICIEKESKAHAQLPPSQTDLQNCGKTTSAGNITYLVAKDQTQSTEIPEDGLNSIAYVVIGYQDSSNNWHSTGFINNSIPVATKFEITSYPAYSIFNGQKTISTPGISNLDVSSVDGHNVGFKIYAGQNLQTDGSFQYGATCRLTHDNQSGSIAVDLIYNQDNPMAYDNSSQQIASACQKDAAGISSGDVDADCCKGSDNTAATCDAANNIDQASGTISGTTPLDNYITELRQNSSNTYGYAYDDHKADFSCPGTASYMIQITSVGSASPPPSPSQSTTYKVSAPTMPVTINSQSIVAGGSVTIPDDANSVKINQCAFNYNHSNNAFSMQDGAQKPCDEVPTISNGTISLGADF